MSQLVTNDRLTFKIDTSEPIEVNDLIKSLKNISNEYKEFAKLKDIEVKVAEVRKGSYEFDLILYSVAPLLAIIDNTTTTIDFIKRMNDLKNLFLENRVDNSSENKPSMNETKMLNSISNHSGNIYNGCTINIYDDNKSGEFKLTDNESKELQTKTSAHITLLKEEQKDEKDKVLRDRVIKLVQRRFDNKNKGNKSICEFLSKNEVTTVFQNTETRNKVLDNATEYLFVVDLEVQYSDNKAVLYKVLDLKDMIEIKEA